MQTGRANLLNLDEIDGFVKANFKNGEDRAEELRDELKKEFDGL